MANNDCLPFYEPGKRVTGVVTTAPVVGKTLVKIGASRAHPVGLQPDASTANNINVLTCTAAAWAFGVAAFDAAVGQLVTIIRGSGYIVPITALGAIAAGAALDAATGGKVATHSAGVIIGYAVADAADGEDTQVALV